MPATHRVLTHAARPSLETRLLLGALAGLVGTAAMTAAMRALHRRLPAEQRYPLPPREIVQKVLPEPAERRIAEDHRRSLTMVAHFGYGAATGALYAVALEHGAIIDKYVGDAIMIFFGDPESRGVSEDALACVRMAIAIQKRMQELSAGWRGSGIEKPLACRIGIHTGYCTVVNFGSEDRMDYTMIGGAVNLASRLESEAPPGGFLISYGTYAHVKNEVLCEEMGSLRVRGIGHPVATFRVVDLHNNLRGANERVRAELPHLKLDVDPKLMSADERREAAALLTETLNRLTPIPVERRMPKVKARTESKRAAGPPAALIAQPKG